MMDFENTVEILVREENPPIYIVVTREDGTKKTKEFHGPAPDETYEAAKAYADRECVRMQAAGKFPGPQRKDS